MPLIMLVLRRREQESSRARMHGSNVRCMLACAFKLESARQRGCGGRRAAVIPRLRWCASPLGGWVLLLPLCVLPRLPPSFANAQVGGVCILEVARAVFGADSVCTQCVLELCDTDATASMNVDACQELSAQFAKSKVGCHAAKVRRI